MPSMGYHITPLPQSDTNWMGVGMNLGQALQTGRNNYDADQLAEANRQAGGLAAAGDLTGARDLMWSQGHPAEGTQWGNLAQAAKTRQEEAGKTVLTQQVGALLAQGTPEARAQAAQMLYKAGRIVEAQNLVSQGQNAQNADVTKQANQAAAAGDWENAAKFAYQSGDTKAGAFFQEKAAEQQKAGIYQGIAKTQAIRNAVASAKTPEDYNKMHDAFVAAGYPAETVDKYRDFSKRDQHLMELDAHQKDLEGSLAPEDREKVANSRARSETAQRTPEEIAEGRKTGDMLAKFSTLDAAKEEWKQFHARLADPVNILATRDANGKVISGAITEREFENSIGRLTTSESMFMPGGIPMREFSNAYGRPVNPLTSKEADDRFATQLAVSKFLKDNVPVSMERLFQQIQPAKGQGSEADRARVVKLYSNLATSSNIKEYRKNLDALDAEMSAIIRGQEAQRTTLRQRAKDLNVRPGTADVQSQAASPPGAASSQMQPGFEYTGPNGHKIMVDPNNPNQIIDVETGRPVQ